MKNKIFITILILILLFFISTAISGMFMEDMIHFRDKIVIIPIKGIITMDNGMIIPFEESISSEIIVEHIKEANKDDSIKGILLDVNSPGGSVVASKEVADAVKNSEKPVVAVMREVGASGAYWVASAADAIVADELTITGSIGVTGSYLEFSELMEKYGVGYERVVSGKYKDIGSPFKELSENEREFLIDKTQKIHLFFITDVANNRNLDPDTVREISHGGVYLGTEAYKLGLVDYLGNKDDAVAILKNMSNLTEAELVKYTTRKSFIDIVRQLSMESFYYMGSGMGSEMKIKETDSISLTL